MKNSPRHLFSRWRAMGSSLEWDVTFHNVNEIMNLLTSEFALWSSMDATDQYHSLDVARAFLALNPEASRDEIAAALLHDVGKSVVHLGRNFRALATVFPFLWPPLRWYAKHEIYGAKTLQRIGSSSRTISLVAGVAKDDAAKKLKIADESQ